MNISIDEESSLNAAQFERALVLANDPSIAVSERIQLLVELATHLQTRPKSPLQLLEAIKLYNNAVKLCSEEDQVLLARIKVRRALCLQIIPEDGSSYLEQARQDLEDALPHLEDSENAHEIAEAHMNIGLVYQALSNFGKAKISEAIKFYQKSLRVFCRDSNPVEFAILHNNLATAYLSIPVVDENARMKEALAVQSFQSALQVVTIENDPVEYAMLQNNLGNALQYSSTAHSLENNLRALEAYDEALKVRNRRNSPLTYANTISNKANCLRNLPDDLQNPASGNRKNLQKALSLYNEAAEIFGEYGESQKFAIVEDAKREIFDELKDIENDGQQ